MNEMVRITSGDMVAVALKPLKAGETVSFGTGEITLREDLPMGHKAALREIRRGEAVIKYGYPIGEATEDIPAGAHVHTHNLHTLLSGEKEYTWHPVFPKQNGTEPASFRGYARKAGKPGIRNELWILPTVGCVNDVAKALAREAQRLTGGSVEGVYAFSHPYGCSQLGDDQDNTRKALAALATHPNAGGVLLLGLGCENSGIEQIRPFMGDFDPDRIRFLVCQECEDEAAGGTGGADAAGRTGSLQRGPADGRSQVRRLGRTERHHGKPDDRRVQRSADSHGRNDNPDGSTGDVRRRDDSDGPV